MIISTKPLIQIANRIEKHNEKKKKTHLKKNRQFAQFTQNNLLANGNKSDKLDNWKTLANQIKEKPDVAHGELRSIATPLTWLFTGLL